MRTTTLRATTPALLAFLTAATLGLPAVSRAAASHDACTGYIDVLPITISAPGTYCLRSDLTSSGPSKWNLFVRIDSADVTIDCNGYRITGDGPSTAIGGELANQAVRRCNISRYEIAVKLTGDAAVVEDNRLHTLGRAGIIVGGDGTAVRRNVITDIACDGCTSRDFPTGIDAYLGSGVIVADNVVDGIVAPPDSASPVCGICVSWQDGASITGNHVSGLVASVGQGVYGILKDNGAGVIAGNSVFGTGTFAGPAYGLRCGTDVVLRDNTLVGFGPWTDPDCIDGGGNVRLD